MTEPFDGIVAALCCRLIQALSVGKDFNALAPNPVQLFAGELEGTVVEPTLAARAGKHAFEEV